MMKNPEMIQSNKSIEPLVSDEKTILNQDKLIWTNSVLVQHQGREVTYYLPCYIRFLLKEITQVEKDSMEAIVSGTLLFSFYYGNIDRSLVEQVVGKDKEKSILLQFNQDESIELRQEKGITKRENKTAKIIDFVVRRPFRVRMKGNVFLTPFITIDLYLGIVVQSVSFFRLIEDGSQGHQQKITFKFNCMDTEKVILLPHGQVMTFSYYRIAPSLFEVKYSNSREYPFDHKTSHQLSNYVQNEDQQIKYFQYAHFKASIYQHPTNSILTIFIPLWTLGLMDLFVFFQDSSFSGRIATISIFVLAFVALIPSINQTIPPSPKIKLVDILITMELFSTILLLIHSFNIRNENSKTYQFVWQQSPIFFLSLLMNIITFTIILVLFILHKCSWQPTYKKDKKDKRIKCKKIDRQMWGNKQCDKYFMDYCEHNPRIEIKNL